MLKTERLKQIESMLKKEGKVEVAALCQRFNVTEMTIRRDLNALVEQKIAVRSHGGAMLDVDHILNERSYDLRVHYHQAEKEAIAKAAFPMITDGARIFFDSSTTAYCLTKLIGSEQSFLAVTDTLTTAMALNARPNVKVICLGGELKKTTCSCAGLFAEQMLAAMHFDVAFIGLANVSPAGIMTTSSMSELSIKQTVIRNSDRAVVLADSSKLGAPEFLRIGSLAEVDDFITDANIPAPFIELCKTIRCNLIIA